MHHSTLFCRGERPAIAWSFAVVMTLLVATSAAHAQTLTVLHNFTGGQDGSGPQGLVAVDRAGNFYGSAPYGGSRGCSGGCGTVFRSSYKNGAWIFTPLYGFRGGDDGATPFAGVTLGPDGAIYGTTLDGGGTGCNGGCGTVFKLTPPAQFCHMALCAWTETVLYRVNNPNDPGGFFGGVILDHAGNIYGMGAFGGTGDAGVVYELSPSGGNNYTLNVLYSFQGPTDGGVPLGNLGMDAAGNLYGTTTYDGAHGYGSVFKLVRNGAGWTFQLLYSFTGGSDGGYPQGNVVLDSAGNLYGATGYGGGVFEITPSGNYSVIAPSLAFLQSPISMGPDGNIYGTNYGDGSHGDGSIFQLAYSQGTWTHNILYSFGNGPGGALPLSEVAFDANGNLYGTTTFGGQDDGAAWQLAP